MPGEGPSSKRTHPKGSTSKRRFWFTIGGSSALVFVLLVLVFNGVVYGQVGVSQVGGFQLTIEEATGTGINIYPGAGDSSNCPDTRPGNPPDPDPKIDENVLPQLYLDIIDATVPDNADLKLTKDIEVPDAVPGTEGVRISLTRDTPNVNQPLNLGNVQAGITNVTAEEISLQGGQFGSFDVDLIIDDDFRGDSQGSYLNQVIDGDQIFGNASRTDLTTDPGGVLTVEGSFGGQLDLKNAQATGHFLSFGALNNLREFQLDIEYISDSSNLNVAQGACPVVGSTLFIFINSVNNPDPGGTLEVNVTVQNPGQDQISGDANLAFDGQQFGSQSVSFSGSGTDTFNLSVNVDPGKSFDFYTAEVNTTELGGGNQFDSDSTQVAVGDPPDFQPTITNVNGPVVEGDTVNVDADIDNNGQISDTQDVVLNILRSGGGNFISGVDSKSITLGNGGSTSDTWQWDTGSEDAGNFLVEIETEQGTDTQSLTVQDDGTNFQVDITGTNTGGPDGTGSSNVVEGETATVTADIENIGAVSGTQTVTFQTINQTSQNAVQRDSESVTLSGGQTKTKTFQWDTTLGNADHTYDYRVFSQNDTQVANDQDILQPELKLIDTNPVSTNNSVDVGSSGSNSNQLSTDVTVENTAGPNMPASFDLTGDVFAEIDRLNDNSFNRIGSQPVTLNENTQQTFTFTTNINQDSNAPKDEDQNSMPVRGGLEQGGGDPEVTPGTRDVSTTLNAPFFDITVNSITPEDDDNENPQIGNTNGGTNVENLDTSITVQNTGSACADADFSSGTEADVFIDNSGGQIYTDGWFTSRSTPLCSGESFTETNTVFSWDADDEMDPESPSDISATVDFEDGLVSSPYQSDLRTAPNTESTGMLHPEEFSYTLNSADNSIVADCADGDCTLNVDFDITNNGDVRDTTSLQLEINDEGANLNGYSAFNEDSIDVTIDSGSTSSNEALSYTASCGQYSENNENYPESFEIDQQGTPISDSQFNVLPTDGNPQNFDVNAGTDGNGKGNTPDPCN